MGRPEPSEDPVEQVNPQRGLEEGREGVEQGINGGKEGGSDPGGGQDWHILDPGLFIGLIHLHGSTQTCISWCGFELT